MLMSLRAISASRLMSLRAISASRLQYSPASGAVTCHRILLNRATNNATEATEDETEIEDASRLQLARFTYSQVKDMTNDFNRMLGEGGYGIVYYGRLSDNHREVAVKVLSENDAPKQFSNEVQVNVLGRIHHKNLVTLIGFCEEGTSNLALVYEYLSGGDLKDLSGLDYLHTGCSPPIVHRDVKPANILLNQHYHQAKVADFGFSKIFPAENVSKLKTRVIGTTAYLAPQYHLTGQVNERSDVYSFGVVLLELMTGKSAIRKNTHPFNLM
uniref:Protein kinase domain-containing protein n=1 Tax=Chenopodium quinoa TaxID=63459 RepID=A0A803KTV6_CHEQI